jgi:nucleoid DNA-binding protein
MLKHEFIKRVAFVSGQSAVTVRNVMAAATAVTKKAVSKGEDVMLCGLGKVKVTKRGEKRARNLHTGETVIVPPRKVVTLQPSTALTQAANEA